MLEFDNGICVSCGCDDVECLDNCTKHRCLSCGYEIITIGLKENQGGIVWTSDMTDELEDRKSLTEEETIELAELGTRIMKSLSCDANGDGFPCRTDRLQAIEDMLHYLTICDVIGEEIP